MTAPLPPDSGSNRTAILSFAAVCVIVFVAVVGYAAFSRGRTATAPAPAAAAPFDVAALETLRARPHVLFRITALGANYGRVGVVPLDAPSSAAIVTPLACDRVHASSGHGLCLQASRGVLTSYHAIAFDRVFAEKNRFPLPGAPSRTRVAAAAPLAASTVFVSGDSYSSGGFSTRTAIYDLGTGAVLGDLEGYTVVRNGAPFKRADFNFWGVTFAADGDRFYATLGTGGDIHFVEGTIRAKQMTVLADGIECPSVSPDGRRVAYKARLIEGGRVVWRVRVRELQSGATVTLNESRSVDDQVEWLDDATILYSLPRDGGGSASSDVWAAPADGSSTPRLYLSDAFSPAVVRPL